MLEITVQLVRCSLTVIFEIGYTSTLLDINSQALI